MSRPILVIHKRVTWGIIFRCFAHDPFRNFSGKCGSLSSKSSCIFKTRVSRCFPSSCARCWVEQILQWLGAYSITCSTLDVSIFESSLQFRSSCRESQIPVNVFLEADFKWIVRFISKKCLSFRYRKSSSLRHQSITLMIRKFNTWKILLNETHEFVNWPCITKS